MNRRLGGAGIRRGLRGPVGGGGPRYLLDYSAATFTRASEAAAVDPRAGWAFYDTATPWPGTDVPRILPDGAILIEGSRTNYQPNSEDLSAWSPVGAVALSGGQAAPDGASDAYRAQALAGGLNRFEQQALWPNTSAGVFSCYVRDAGAGGIYQIHDRTGTVYASGGTLPAAYERVAVSVPAPTITLHVSNVADGADRVAGGGIAAGARDGIYWGVQSEQGAFPSSPIRTSGAAATRAVEVCEFANATVLDSGRWAVDIWPSMTHAELAGIGHDPFIALRDSSNYLLISRGGGSPRFRVFAGGVQLCEVIATWSRHQRITLTVDWGARTFAVDGATTGDGSVPLTGANTWAGATGTLLRIGAFNSGGGSPFFGVISRPRAA